MLQVVALVSTIVAMVRCTPGVRCTWMGYHLQVQRTPGVRCTEPGDISIHDRQNRQLSLRDHRILQHEIALTLSRITLSRITLSRITLSRVILSFRKVILTDLPYWSKL
jgi:hypothetical protein